MIRFSEMVLPGHPDKLCDQIADAVLAEAYRADPQAYGQIEVAAWCDEFFLTGGIATRKPLAVPLEEIVRRVGREVGYTGSNAIQADRWVVRDAVCRDVRDPREWTEHVNDQCLVVGYAFGDARTRFLPPEHYLAHVFREALTAACREPLAPPGVRARGEGSLPGKGEGLQGQGPDGKLLVRMREEGERWTLEHVLVTLQQLESTPFMDVCAGVAECLSLAYEGVRRADPRWLRPWAEVDLLVNPNGPLINGGPDGDNGQTGRKLAMDFYGPRVPQGGGALSGKDLTHIDRAGSYAARRAAVQAVSTGASECLVKVAYAPNVDAPLDVVWEMRGSGSRTVREAFAHSSIRREAAEWGACVERGVGDHFWSEAPWNEAPMWDEAAGKLDEGGLKADLGYCPRR
ncbi:MAG: methionine adenosyltransferase domain-containing protein [Fimbriimonadaceae bacterium]|nr:methionine adenosyltransferase domain-containing protein [Chthonomonadaceae bacterium]MCO5298049.1 methionine adenosyltransferase domain-containing protein [Fimbriimonadaceae bacterium]